MKTPRAARLRWLPPALFAAVACGVWPGAGQPAFAHDLGAAEHPHYDRTVKPPEAISRLPRVAQANPAAAVASRRPDASTRATADRPGQAGAFLAFSPRVAVRWDDAFLYVESNGLPAHGMMIGITAWQQQVPLPQSYIGRNAWRIPRVPVPSDQPVSIKGRFLRGAIALAANGIPIFNPQNNRGELSAEIGELDEWGGHCGRADDYHYHAAPLHLQKVLGPALPIAFALDGYPIFGLTEPDGSTPAKLDAFNGHETATLGYHYHGSMTYPYINGGFHGTVMEREEQVDPQPRAESPRPAAAPLRGAKITGFRAADDEKSFTLRYVVNGAPAAIDYAISGNGAWTFRFTNSEGSIREETFRAGGRGGGPAGEDAGRKGGKAGKQRF